MNGGHEIARSYHCIESHEEVPDIWGLDARCRSQYQQDLLVCSRLHDLVELDMFASEQRTRPPRTLQKARSDI